jgi:hypothetical protein
VLISLLLVFIRQFGEPLRTLHPTRNVELIIDQVRKGSYCTDRGSNHPLAAAKNDPALCKYSVSNVHSAPLMLCPRDRWVFRSAVLCIDRATVLGL